ncbi:MAG: hypothetical protein SGJ11_03290 [Phycisphaerae bacterium]|nr:hypothetical protein [Phycisphaerae bacterium]
MIAALTRLGATVLSTVEVEENFIWIGLSNFAISFLSDDIVRLSNSRVSDASIPPEDL